MDRCPKDEPTVKNFSAEKALPISEKNWKNLLGGWHPPPTLMEGQNRAIVNDTHMFKVDIEYHNNISFISALPLQISKQS